MSVQHLSMLCWPLYASICVLLTGIAIAYMGFVDFSKNGRFNAADRALTYLIGAGIGIVLQGVLIVTEAYLHVPEIGRVAFYLPYILGGVGFTFPSAMRWPGMILCLFAHATALR